MKIITAILALSTLFVPAWAQTKDPQLPAGVRLYQPKNLTGQRALSVSHFVGNVASVSVSWDDVPHAFVIRGTVQEQDMAQALLKRYDVPEPDIELTVYLVRAAFTAPAGSQVQGQPVPPELKSAIDEMKGAFHYERFTLWDEVVLRPKGESGEVRGVLPGASFPTPYVYTVSYRRPEMPADPKVLNLSDFTASVMMSPKNNVESHIVTSDVTIHEGQKLVIGKIRLMPDDHADLFLVLTAKFN